ncbi:hypothetical protein IWZ03DRAFT_357693 [Phyllosticta citriasiana]|uniref:Uncharacterized protein n=1 Tax=Phyllosticta citriasiana TaxID=595635 RepID=A0ABR1KZQ4_9PEZI
MEISLSNVRGMSINATAKLEVEKMVRRGQDVPEKGAFLTFAGIITATTAWMIWGNGDIFPREPDPTGDPEEWTVTALKRWLNKRNLLPNHEASRAELVERVKANMRPPPRR